VNTPQVFHVMDLATVMPGKLPLYLQRLTKTALALRGDCHGELLGLWTTDFGIVDQVVLLWSYADVARYAAAMEALNGNAQWLTCETQMLHPLVSGRTVELLHAARPVLRSTISENLFELRTYAMHPGTSRAFIDDMAGVMPVREKYHRNFGLWRPLAGDMDRVFHMWLYDNLEHRAAVRAQCAREPEWQAYLERTIPFTKGMHSALLKRVAL
jgi:NIPSNAP